LSPITGPPVILPSESRSDDGNVERLRELALRVLDPWWVSGQATQVLLVVAGLPPDLRVALPQPKGSRLVGSYFDGRATTSVLLDVSLQEDQVLAYYDLELVSAGWTRIERHPPLGGFDKASRRADSPKEGWSYCRSSNGPFVVVQPVGSSNGLTAVRLSLNTDPLQAPCAGPGEPAGSAPIIPVLLPPPGSELMPRSRAGAANYAVLTAEVVSDLGRAAVASHYDLQLDCEGWTCKMRQVRGSQVWSAWTYHADDQPGRRGTLFLSLVQHVGFPPRSGPLELKEEPKVVQKYWLEIRAGWRADEATPTA